MRARTPCERLVYSIFRRAKARSAAEEFHEIYINNTSGRLPLSVNKKKQQLCIKTIIHNCQPKSNYHSETYSKAFPLPLSVKLPSIFPLFALSTVLILLELDVLLKFELLLKFDEVFPEFELEVTG